MNLTPANAVAVTQNAWNVARRFDYDRARERVILKIMSAIERNIRRCCTTDQVEPIVRNWAGTLSNMVSVGELRAHGVLVLHASHPAVVMELKPRLPRLLEDLKSTGIKEIRLR